jgi:putative ABC transport system ATP-binding protein
MKSLNEDRGMTFIFSTHDNKIMDRARRLVHVLDGKVDQEELK